VRNEEDQVLGFGIFEFAVVVQRARSEHVVEVGGQSEEHVDLILVFDGDVGVAERFNLFRVVLLTK